MIVTTHKSFTLAVSYEEAVLIHDALEVIDPDDGDASELADGMVVQLRRVIGDRP
jgi:hypothetical protein